MVVVRGRRRGRRIGRRDTEHAIVVGLPNGVDFEGLDSSGIDYSIWILDGAKLLWVLQISWSID